MEEEDGRPPQQIIDRGAQALLSIDPYYLKLALDGGDAKDPVMSAVRAMKNRWVFYFALFAGLPVCQGTAPRRSTASEHRRDRAPIVPPVLILVRPYCSFSLCWCCRFGSAVRITILELRFVLEMKLDENVWMPTGGLIDFFIYRNEMKYVTLLWVGEDRSPLPSSFLPLLSPIIIISLPS